MTAIWFHNEIQHDIIKTAQDAIQSQLSAKIQTPVLPLDAFYLAEDYHQKYRLQNSQLQTQFRAMYPVFEDFNNSTAAARLNGFLAGEGSQPLLEEERKDYGIDAEQLTANIRLRQPTGCKVV